MICAFKAAGSVRLAVIALLIIMGCTPAAPSRDLADITGTVSYKDEPVALGTISFQPSRGMPITAPIENGQFMLQGVVGMNRVIIISRDPLPEIDPEVPPPVIPPPLPQSHIPEKYSFPNSPLEFLVEPGSNHAEFILNDDHPLMPRKP